MYIKLAGKDFPMWDNPDGDAHFEIGLILGWHLPNLSLRTPNFTVNQTPRKAVFYLMYEYFLLDMKRRGYVSDRQEK